MVQKDAISAGDGARRNEIDGKGALSGRTAANVFGLLNRSGIPTHLVDALSGSEMVVRRCRMIPLEVVMRRLATGSFLRRHADVAEGTRFDPVLVEFFLKDDARHDPQIAPGGIVSEGIGTAEEVAAMTEQGRERVRRAGTRLGCRRYSVGRSQNRVRAHHRWAVDRRRYDRQRFLAFVACWR